MLELYKTLGFNCKETTVNFVSTIILTGWIFILPTA